MPWNDDSNPGPWGAPPKGDEPKRPANGDRNARPDNTRPDNARPDDAKPDDAKPDNGQRGEKAGPWGSDAPRPRLPRRPETRDRRLLSQIRKPAAKDSSGGSPDGPQVNGPNLDELTRQLRERFEHLFVGGQGHGVRREVVWAVLGVIVGAWALSGVYVVQPEQEGVVTRFGQYIGQTGPGLNYHLPAPIEQVEKVSTTSVRSLDIGAASANDTATPSDATPAADAQDQPSGALMLTGDENIVDLDFTVQWRVDDPAKFLFRLSDPDSVVKMVAESAMREAVGQTPLQDIMTTGRGQLQAQAAARMQRILDSYGAGVSIVEVQVRGANPPKEVIPAFREVINAGQDAETAVNQADAYRNRVVNEAKGDAAKIVQDAEGYSQQAVLEAQGEASRFSQIDDQYRHAPAVTRQRLYLETMQRVLANSNKVIVDTPKGSTAPIVLPPDIFRHGDPAPQPAPSPAPAAQPQSGGSQTSATQAAPPATAAPSNGAAQ